jgi:hypothetical protein
MATTNGGLDSPLMLEVFHTRPDIVTFSHQILTGATIISPSIVVHL